MNIESPPPLDNLKKFELRCWALATLYREDELGLHEAVDRCERIRLHEFGGAPALLDADLGQAVMARAFAAVRDDLTAALKTAMETFTLGRGP